MICTKYKFRHYSSEQPLILEISFDNILCLILQQPVADPGFPVGGAPTHWGGANLRRIHFSVKMYAKTKEIDPVGGGGGGGVQRGAPPGSTNGNVTFKKINVTCILTLKILLDVT